MQFMSGRYGADETFFVIFIAAVILSVVNIFIRFVSLGLYLVIQLLVYAMIIYSLFRIFSRNLEQRRRENMWAWRSAELTPSTTAGVSSTPRRKRECPA